MKRLFICVLVLTAVALPALSVAPVEPATADSDRSCDIDNYRNETDNYGKSASLVGKVFGDYEDPKWDCEDLQDDLSYYQAAASMRSGYFSFVTTYDNSLQDSALGAYSEMEKTVLWSYDNDTSLANAKIEAKDSFGRFYTVKEQNYLQNWRAIAHATNTWENQSQYNMFEPGYSLDFDQSKAYLVQNEDPDTVSDPANFQQEDLEGFSVEFVGLETETKTLANGSEMSVPLLKFDVTLDIAYSDYPTVHPTETVTVDPYDGEWKGNGTNAVWTFQDGAGDTVHVWGEGVAPQIGSLQVQPPPDSDQSTLQWVQFEQAKDRLDTLHSEYENFDQSYEAYTEGIYNGLDTGRISYSDAISRATQVDSYLQQSAEENATFSIATVGLAGAGLDAVNVANTSYMEIQFDAARYTNDTNPVTREGMLLSRGAPADGWQFNTTYESANISGGQMVLDLDGEEYTINGTFEIIRAYDNDGNPMDASEIQNPDTDRLEAYNATSYVEMLNDTREQITELEQKLSDGASGPGSGVDFDIPNPLTWLAQVGAALQQWLVILAVVFLALLLLAVVS